MQDILEGLNPQQRQAVEHVEGPLLIVAGPGSGKTRVITHRVAYLVRVCRVQPHRVCAVTFTNRAAREMKERLARLLPSRSGDLTVGTFHALCASILRRDGEAIGLDRSFVIYDEEDQLALLKQALEEANVDPKRYAPRAILDAVSGAKAQLIGPEEYRGWATTYYGEIIQRAYQKYQELLGRVKALDFDDLLLKTYWLFRDHSRALEKYQSRYLHLLIDEFQDTNTAQYAIARQLAGRWRNICVVGDPDQSIYSWRHADIRNILSFQKDFPEARVVTLEENYRSTGAILEAAQRVIAANTQRLEKRLFTRKERGVSLTVAEGYSEEDEARQVIEEAVRLHDQEGYRFGDCAVMYRVNAQSRAYEEACSRYGIPYQLVGALRFYQRREVKDVIAYLRLLVNPADDVSFLRVANVPPRGIGQKTLDELTRWARASGLSLSGALERLAAGEPPSPAIPSAGKAALERLSRILQELREATHDLGITQLFDLLLERTGYKQLLLASGDEGEERWENIQELRGLVGEFSEMELEEALTAFLERVALVSDQDNLDEQKDRLTLITLHQAKGLEFPAVFIVGMEEGLLPHARSFDDPAEMEEERRLCYVGMTRAKERLYLFRSFRRRTRGESGPSIPSRFLRDIPNHLIAAPAPATQPVLSRDGLGRTEEAPMPARPPLKAGDQVRHARFGEGVVVSCVPSGSDHEVTVAFRDGVVKRLLYSFAPLEKVE